MKKILSALTAIILAVAIYGNAGAQQASPGKAGNELKLSMALTNTGESANTISAKANAAGLNVKALKDFQRSFKNVSNASWFVTDEGTMLASFTVDAVQNTVAYDKKGRWIYSIKRYDEAQLPKEIRSGVKSVYYDYSIAHVEEVSINDRVIYIVHLEDATTMKTLRIENGEIEEAENFIKG